ncbi:MFS transporter, partial [Streptomyces sp. NPDC058955]|uniref:MFS transporter n=1 Tax=Streptomyces sp. NPDC058955 TaxID=3346678 RepID=UPI0036B2637C
PLVTAAVPAGAARPRAIGTWTAVGAAGGAAGGFVGGLLVDLLNWRWVLLVNVPLGALILAAAALWLREGRADAGRRLDLPGAVLVTAGLATLAYGIVQTEMSGWTSAATLLPLLGGLALLGAFVAVERRTGEPLVPLGIFRNRAVSAANTGMMLGGAASFAMWFFMTVYAQNVLGYPPLQAGLALVPSSLAVLVGSKAAPRLMAVTGARNLAVIGLLVAAAGFAWQSTMTADGTFLTTILGPGLVMMGGLGLATTPLATLATSGAAPGDAGLVSGLVNTSRTMGGALGLAVLTTVAAAVPTGPDLAPLGTPDGSHLVPGYAMAFRVSAAILLTAAVLMAVWLPRPVHRTVQKP